MRITLNIACACVPALTALSRTFPHRPLILLFCICAYVLRLEVKYETELSSDQRMRDIYGIDNRAAYPSSVRHWPVLAPQCEVFILATFAHASQPLTV